MPFFTFNVNHELNSAPSAIRDHSAIGAFVSEWKVDKGTLAVLEGDDLIKEFYDWNEDAQSLILSNATFDRMCPSDLPPQPVLFNDRCQRKE